MKLKRIINPTIALGVLAAGAVACGSAGTVSYAPAAYGQTVGGVFQCYWVDYPQEATALINAGLCPPGAVPVHMPASWLNEYFLYYDSSSYYGTFVPATYRTRYVSTETTYYHVHQVTIVSAEKTARYKGSNGKIVTGSKLKTGKTTFGSGSSSTTRRSGGSLRVGGTSKTGGSSGKNTGSTTRRTSSGSGSGSGSGSTTRRSGGSLRVGGGSSRVGGRH